MVCPRSPFSFTGRLLNERCLLIQRERKIFLVQLLVGAVAHHLAERLVEGFAQLDVLAAQTRRDADAEGLRILDVLADQFAAVAVRLLRPQPELRLVAEYGVDLVGGQRLQRFVDGGVRAMRSAPRGQGASATR